MTTNEVVANIEARLTELRAQRDRAETDRRRTAEHLAAMTAEGAADSEREKLRRELVRLEAVPRELGDAIELLDHDLAAAKESERIANIRDTEAAAVSEAKGYVVAFLDAEAVQMQCVRAFVPAFNWLMAARAKSIVAHAAALRASGESPQYAQPWDERVRGLPIARAQAFWALARKLARAGGSAYIGEPPNRCPQCGEERQ